MINSIARSLLGDAPGRKPRYLPGIAQAIVVLRPWWDPDAVWQQAKKRTATVFGHHAGAAPMPLDKAA